MFKIINEEGRIFELNQNTVIDVERSNSLFGSDDSFAHDITYPGQGGLTDSNKLFIQNGHLVESKNSVYDLPVQVHVAGYQFYTAIFSYKIVKSQIEYVLKVNFGAVAARMKATNINEIYTLDTVIMGATQAAMADYMKDTCTNPLNYNCVFFPLYNEDWDSVSETEGSKWINEWDHDNQKFNPPPNTGGRTKWNLAPFFRLSYVLKKIFEYLKFDTAGSYWSDPSSQELYLYTRRGLTNYAIASSLSYMPKIAIFDFLKSVTERLKISFDIDLMNNLVTVETPGTALGSDECIDITKYIESVDEKSVPEQKGYYITLAVDDTDLAMNRGTDDEELFVAPSALVVGNGENVIEMEIGTLSQVDTDTYSYPQSKQTFSNQNGEEVTEWPIRLLRFKGMKVLPDAKVFPEATAFNLTDEDASWFKFLNDSKKVIISARIPPSIVAKMRPTIKLACISDKSAFFYALPEKNSYQMSNLITERILVKIEARTIVSDFDTKSYIKIIDQKVIENKNIEEFKAYWDPATHGFDEINVQRIPNLGSTTLYGYTPITSSTDDGGIGGTIGTVFQISGSRDSAQLRLFSPIKPQYYISAGKKGFFTAVSNYFTFDTIICGVKDGRPVWIVY